MNHKTWEFFVKSFYYVMREFTEKAQLNPNFSLSCSRSGQIYKDIVTCTKKSTNFARACRTCQNYDDNFKVRNRCSFSKEISHRIHWPSYLQWHLLYQSLIFQIVKKTFKKNNREKSKKGLQFQNGFSPNNLGTQKFKCPPSFTFIFHL